MSKNTETSIVAANQAATSINQFFGNIDFEKLSAAIVNLANHNSLTEIEKTSALEIIDSWQENVIDKLRLESDKIDRFLSCMQATNTSRYFNNTLAGCINEQTFIDEIEFLIDKVNMRDTYEQLIDALSEYTIADANAKTQTQVVIDVNTTVEDEILQRKDLEIERIKNDAAITKIGNKIAKLTREILTAINSDKEIIANFRTLKKQATALKKASTVCVDKAQLAKINVTIDDPNTRESLAELINFTI